MGGGAKLHEFPTLHRFLSLGQLILSLGKLILSLGQLILSLGQLILSLGQLIQLISGGNSVSEVGGEGKASRISDITSLC